MQVESCATPLLSEGIVCLPKQEKEEDAMIDYSYNPYSPAKHPAVGQKRKRAPKKEKVEKKTKTKKIKQELEGTSQRTLDEWLKKDTPLKVILKKQSSSSLRNVYFLFKVEVRNLYKKWESVKKKQHTFLGFNFGRRLRNTKPAFCTETKRTNEGADTRTLLETARTQTQTCAHSDSHNQNHA